MCRVNTPSLTCKSEVLYLAPETLALMEVTAIAPCGPQLRIEGIHEPLFMVREDSVQGPSGGYQKGGTLVYFKTYSLTVSIAHLHNYLF